MPVPLTRPTDRCWRSVLRGRALLGCARGVLPGKVGLTGIIAVYGRSRSCWFDVHRRSLRREEAIPGLPCRLRGWLVWYSRRLCAAVYRCI